MPTAFHLAIAAALAPFAPPQSEVQHQAQRPSWMDWPAHPAEFTQEELRRADLAIKRHKESGAELQERIDREVRENAPLLNNSGLRA